MKERLGILISGSGTTMAEVIKQCNSGFIKMDVSCVVSSSPDAFGVKRAMFLGIHPDDIIILSPSMFKYCSGKNDLGAFGGALLHELQKREITVVTQNGWIPKTPENVINAYKNRIFNQHPGPVPEFGGLYGRQVHLAVLLFRKFTKRDIYTEAVIQRVEAELDQGVVVKKRKVPILPKDSVEDLQKRVLPFEHQAQIALLRDFEARTVWEYPKHGRYTKPLITHPGETIRIQWCKDAGRAAYPEG